MKINTLVCNKINTFTDTENAQVNRYIHQRNQSCQFTKLLHYFFRFHNLLQIPDYFKTTFLIKLQHLFHNCKDKG